MIDFTEMVNINLMHDLPKVEGGHAGATTSSATASSPVIAPAPTQSVAAPSPPKVQEIPPKEVTQKAPESSGKCSVEAPSSQRKKARVSGRHKSCREGEKLKSRATDGKTPVAPVERTSAPKTRLKSVKELCSAHLRADGRDFHVIEISSQPEHAPDVPLEVDLTPLTHGICIW
ncbi:hypothetical protein GW17_00026139 [Ensete ventricosum]|nr:hypothetical protein GW17_00026139 [Ensete ventricosum]